MKDPSKNAASPDANLGRTNRIINNTTTSLLFHTRGENATEKHRVRGYWRYLVLLGVRNAVGALPAFECAGCRTVQLDPCGWTDDGRPLCDRCADGGDQ